MSFSAPKTSARLRNAAAAELARVQRDEAELAARRRELLQSLEQVDEALTELREQRGTLERLAGPAAGSGPAGRAGAGAEPRPAAGESAAVDAPAAARIPAGARRVLSGPAIRERAVALRMAQGDPGAPLHYRDWLALLEGEGYAVAGQDPLATFLTQLTRSPVVRKAGGRGMYEIDTGAPDRLRGELATAHAQLRALTDPGAQGAADVAATRARREELGRHTGQLERMLAEAQSVLSAPTQSEPTTALPERSSIAD